MPSLNSKKGLLALGLPAVVAVYGAIAYVALPFGWRHHEHQKGLDRLPTVTRTAEGLPGDPLNVGLVGTTEDVICAMHAAGWIPADPVTLRSAIRIVGSVLLDRTYAQAPVSDLFFEGRREDLAFQKPSGTSPARRHHVRFWMALDRGDEGRPVWLGAATFDRGVRLNRYTGQITHRIASDVDHERNLLSDDLRSGRVVQATYQVSGVGPVISARNGGGDAYHTDGEIWISRLVSGCGERTDQIVELPSPLQIELKDFVWRSVSQALGR